jgi:hypothetical protein
VPNGNHGFDLASVEAWFSPLAPTIIDFMNRRNLHLDKYYHDSPCWSLRFAHPCKGVGTIDILRSDDEVVGIGAHWHLDDEALRRRFIHWRSFVRLGKDAKSLEKALEDELGALCATPLGQWTLVSGLSMPPAWAITVRPKYPVPKL